MNVVLWILAGLAAAGFLASGMLKLTQSKEQLAGKGMAWTEDFSPRTIKLIGILEILGAAGLILPGALKIAPVLVPIAATGLGLVMLGAISTHLRRKETAMVVPPLILLVVAVIVAWARFGPHQLTS